MRIRLVPQLGYLDFLRLMSEARVVLTDSGGIQDETTMLGVPCITLQDSTERPVTLERGTNVLGGRIRKRLSANLTERTVLDGNRPGLPATGTETRPNESSKYCSMIVVVSDLWLHLAGGSSLGRKSEVKAPPRTVRMQAELYRGRDRAWDEYVSARSAATFFREWNSGKNFPSFARWALVPMRRGQWRDSSESSS